MLMDKKFSTNLYVNINDTQWPIVYRKEYNVNFLGLERLHPFDAGKWANVFKNLKEHGLVTKKNIAVPNEATKDDLLLVHTKKYLKSLKCSLRIAGIAEVIPLIFVPNYFIQRAYLRPMRFQTGGSVLAGKLALERGWAINIGGGFHHCSSTKGGGFCAYADITLMIKFLFKYFPKLIRKVMIVDLDAHQGNGYEHDFKDNPNIYIMDVFNKWIYPHDKDAKKFINRKVQLDYLTSDGTYLNAVETNLREALSEFHPDLLVYNAGTDVLKGDSLGGLAVTEEGIKKRDEVVFREAKQRKIPIVMLTSGGYLKKTAKIISESIIHLYELGLIQGPPKMPREIYV